MFKIMGIYEGYGELVDEFETEEEAEKMLAEYRLAFGPGWFLYIKGKARKEVLSV